MKQLLIMCDVTGHGGVSVYLAQLARAANCSGWTANIIMDDNRNSDPVESYLARQGVIVQRASIRCDARSDEYVSQVVGEILDATQPNLVHAVLGSPRSLLVPREVCLQRDIPLVMTEQYIARDLAIPAQMRKRIRKIYKGASAVIFVCKENEHIARNHFRFLPRRGLMISNSVDCSKLPPRRLRHSKEVLTVARLTQQKGIDVLIQAAAVVRTVGVRFTIAGDGSQLEHLQSLASQANLGEDKLRFLGWREDISDLLATHDLFVLPSRSEGQPFALLEALSAGLPCIAAAVSGIPELLAHGSIGELVPPDDHSALASAIDQFFDQPTLLWHKADGAREHLRTHYCASTNLKHTIELWTDTAR